MHGVGGGRAEPRLIPSATLCPQHPALHCPPQTPPSLLCGSILLSGLSYKLENTSEATESNCRPRWMPPAQHPFAPVPAGPCSSGVTDAPPAPGCLPLPGHAAHNCSLRGAGAMLAGKAPTSSLIALQNPCTGRKCISAHTCPATGAQWSPHRGPPPHANLHPST